MKTGMKCLILLCIGAALCYGIYSFDQVNRENDRLKVTTFSDRKSQTINRNRVYGTEKYDLRLFQDQGAVSGH